MAREIIETYEEIGGKEYIDHDINADLDYSRSWAKWLAIVGGDTIVTLTPILEAPLMLGDNGSQIDAGNTATRIWVKGGVDGAVLGVTHRIVTAAGRKDDRTVYLRCKQR